MGRFQGTTTSNVTFYNSIFQANGSGAGISGSSTDVTLGGIVYIGIVNIVEVVNSTFQQISLVGLGGGLFVTSAVFLDVKNSTFNQIVVSTTGGLFYLCYINIWRYYYVFCFFFS